MNHTKFYTVSLIVLCLLAGEQRLCAQKSDLTFTFDSASFFRISSAYLQPGSFLMEHSPTRKDERNFKKRRWLIDKAPTSKNHKHYISLACSLWELEKLAEAEKMFLTIIHSEEKYYRNSYYHSSDIPGDNSSNTYGYGSFTSNYKNTAALYLTRIYLEQKKFDKALFYLEEAVNKYVVTYSCGTGANWQEEKYNFLYASCYVGLNRHKDVIDLLLPTCLSYNYEHIITAIKKTYTEEDIEKELKNAEASIRFLPDTFESYIIHTKNEGTPQEKTDTVKYFSGTASIQLFGRQVNIPALYPENGENLEREIFVTLFRNSAFYNKLKTGT